MSDPQISDIKFRTEAENNLSCKVREYGPDKFRSIGQQGLALD